MTTTSQVARNISFVKQLWKNKAAVRALLSSQNFIFVSDYLPGHFYSPIPDLPEIDAHVDAIFDRSPKTVSAIDLNEREQLRLIDVFSKTYREMPFRKKPTPGYRYYLDNPFFSFGDGVILYSFLRHFRPKRVIEIGSGFSSAAMLDVRDCFFDTPTKFTFIEPRPERLLSILTEKDKSGCQIETQLVQHVGIGMFEDLEENDILFVDSSHVGKIQSDVLHIIFNIFPRLKKGVIVHIHDVPWPFEYPENWVRKGRAYNEAYLLRAFLQYNAAFEILFFNSFIARHHAELIKRMMPRLLEVPSTKETESNSSIWLRKVL
jgi:predicted O-methyltransferase YrrM